MDIDPLEPIIPHFDPPSVFDTTMGNELDTDQPESVPPNPSPPKGSARKHAFDKELKESARGARR